VGELRSNDEHDRSAHGLGSLKGKFPSVIEDNVG